MSEEHPKIETYKHIAQVQRLLSFAIIDLVERSRGHDQSKLLPPESTLFEEYTPKLWGCAYGSEEYKQFLKELGPALAHHYASNRHHPEHFAEGIHDMTLLDLLEMVCDWMAAVSRHADGDIYRSIKINAERFGYSSELARIFENTVRELGVLSSGK